MEKKSFGFTNSVTLEVSQDDCPESPREWDNISTWYYWRSNLKIDVDARISRMVDRAEFEQYLSDEGIKDVVSVFPLYMMDHGGQSVSMNPFGCRWDSGQFGWAVITKDDLRGYGETHPDPKVIVQAEVEAYDMYLRGEVYQFTVCRNGEVLDSCCSIYDEDAALGDGMLAAKCLAEELDMAPRFQFGAI
jgi:hypothetical protein